MKKKIDKNYLKWCKCLFVLLPKLKKYSSDRMIAICIKYSVNKEYKDFLQLYSFCLNEKTSKLFDELDLIVRNLLPYLDDVSISRICGMEVIL